MFDGLGVHAFSICMGLVVGSFLNVVVARLPHGKSVVHPRSGCPSCQHFISWYDNIPIISFLLLRGKCRHCHDKISFRYPMIELLTAVVFLAAEMKYDFTLALFVRHWPFVSILIAVTFIDLEHRIIPDALSLGGCLLGIATSWMPFEIGWRSSFVGFLFGFGAFYLLGLLYFKLRKRTGIGGGDVKLLGMMGTFLGLPGVFVTILLSSILGSLVGIVWAVASRRRNLMKFAIPYGPFLVFGALCYYLLGDKLWFQFMIPM